MEARRDGRSITEIRFPPKNPSGISYTIVTRDEEDIYQAPVIAVGYDPLALEGDEYYNKGRPYYTYNHLIGQTFESVDTLTEATSDADAGPLYCRAHAGEPLHQTQYFIEYVDGINDKYGVLSEEDRSTQQQGGYPIPSTHTAFYRNAFYKPRIAEAIRYPGNYFLGLKKIEAAPFPGDTSIVPSVFCTEYFMYQPLGHERKVSRLGVYEENGVHTLVWYMSKANVYPWDTDKDIGGYGTYWSQIASVHLFDDAPPPGPGEYILGADPEDLGEYAPIVDMVLDGTTGVIQTVRYPVVPYSDTSTSFKYLPEYTYYQIVLRYSVENGYYIEKTLHKVLTGYHDIPDHLDKVWTYTTVTYRHYGINWGSESGGSADKRGVTTVALNSGWNGANIMLWEYYYPNNHSSYGLIMFTSEAEQQSWLNTYWPGGHTGAPLTNHVPFTGPYVPWDFDVQYRQDGAYPAPGDGGAFVQGVMAATHDMYFENEGWTATGGGKGEVWGSPIYSVAHDLHCSILDTGEIVLWGIRINNVEPQVSQIYLTRNGIDFITLMDNTNAEGRSWVSFTYINFRKEMFICEEYTITTGVDGTRASMRLAYFHIIDGVKTYVGGTAAIINTYDTHPVYLEDPYPPEEYDYPEPPPQEDFEHPEPWPYYAGGFDVDEVYQKYYRDTPKEGWSGTQEEWEEYFDTGNLANYREVYYTSEKTNNTYNQNAVYKGRANYINIIDYMGYSYEPTINKVFRCMNDDDTAFTYNNILNNIIRVSDYTSLWVDGTTDSTNNPTVGYNYTIAQSLRSVVSDTGDYLFIIKIPGLNGYDFFDEGEYMTATVPEQTIVISNLNTAALPEDIESMGGLFLV